jgi:hypothetical protein
MARILRNWLFVDKFVYTHTVMWSFMALFALFALSVLFAQGTWSDVRRLSE